MKIEPEAPGILPGAFFGELLPFDSRPAAIYTAAVGLSPQGEMESFRNTHPNYASYASAHFYVDEVPKQLFVALHGLIVRYSPDTDGLKRVANIVRSYLPEPPTQNWGHDWIANDLDDAIRALSSKPLHKFMDCVGSLLDHFYATSFSNDLEELFVEHSFGFMVKKTGPVNTWALRDDTTETKVAVIEDAQETVEGICEQTLSHLRQAKENLRRADERSRKDALRDAMSAMESLYKRISGKDDIADAWKSLRDAGNWGPSEIVKDGYSVWNTLHHLYPDVRHGQANASTLTEDEAMYWIERILAFVKYIARKNP